MGLNIVIGCATHQTRTWIWRGHEDHVVARFYRKHWDCARHGQVFIGDDQSDHPWLHDDRWTEKSEPFNV